jgi:hypothetical protein
MSSADATFAVATAIDKHREAVEKQTKAFEGFAKALNETVLSVNFQRANTIPKQTSPQDANAGSLRPRDTTPTQASAATSGPWKENRYGEWIFSNANEPLRDTLRAAPDHTVILNGMKYKLSGSPQEPEKFINRQPVAGGKA